jgi:hypothetical protein
MVGVTEGFAVPDDLARAAASEGRTEWLAGLPALVGRIAADLQIEVDQPFFPGGATAWVAQARDAAGKDVVLKVGWPHPEAVHEADGLRTWGGAGAVRLYRAEALPEATVLLLEQCRPGTQLRTLPKEQHDLVIAGLLRRLWTEPPPGHCFRRECPRRRTRALARDRPQALRRRPDLRRDAAHFQRGVRRGGYDGRSRNRRLPHDDSPLIRGHANKEAQGPTSQ